MTGEGGRGPVRRGGKGELAMDVRGLAPSFTGHLDAEALRLAGLVEGEPAALAAATARFAGPAPRMSDMF